MPTTPVRSLAVPLSLLGLLALSPRPGAADGGDTSLIHACATATVRGTGAFLRVIGANESCPPGQTPVHWPGSVGDDPPPPATQRFVIRDANGTEFGTFGGFDNNGTAMGFFSTGGRTFVLTVARERVIAATSPAYYQTNNCTGPAFLQVFVLPIVPLLPVSRAFVQTDVGPPFNVVVQSDPTETGVQRNFSSVQQTEGPCDPSDFNNVLTVSATVVTLNPVPPFTVTLE